MQPNRIIEGNQLHGDEVKHDCANLQRNHKSRVTNQKLQIKSHKP